MTVPTTLLETELIEAAKRVKCPSYTMCFGCPACDLSNRLWARAARVREWEREMARTDKLPLRPGVFEVFLALTGPLPSPPGTGSGETG